MRKASLRRLFMVLAKIPRRVKKLLRNNGCLQLYLAQRVKQHFAARTDDVGAARSEMNDVVETFPRRLQTSVSAAEQRPHVGRDQGISHAVENRFALDIAQVECTSRVQVNNLMVANQRANARLPRTIFKSQKFHRSLPASESNLRFY